MMFFAGLLSMHRWLQHPHSSVPQFFYPNHRAASKGPCMVLEYPGDDQIPLVLLSVSGWKNHIHWVFHENCQAQEHFGQGTFYKQWDQLPSP
ncbi:hypothetical protein TorRG33x02_287550 [Trema orientale]|uniref:Uncharacterized protein n=1 Tax=Trema orientale TaxID=63057 RepID=A0A2P5CF51_TREOI|nr:hypothetical protein TorRG33x02_287550 [Trema orientale]